MRTTFSVPVGCGHDLLSGSNQSKRTHRGNYRLASITHFGWDRSTLVQTGQQLLAQFPLGSRKPAMVIKDVMLSKMGALLDQAANLPSNPLLPGETEVSLTDHMLLGLVYLLMAIQAAEPGSLAIQERRAVCRIATKPDGTITIQLLRALKPISAKQAIASGQFRHGATHPKRLVPA